MENNRERVSGEMERRAYDFLGFQREYYAGRAGDTALMDRTTQPFWQSLRLSRRRLADKGLAMDVELARDAKSKTVRDEGLHVREDGYHLAGSKAMNVKVRRRFYQNGKRISTARNREICKLHLLKAQVDGDKAACPNCGYVGTVTSFIDGCDACDAKFTVQDFEPKISAFSLEENTGEKIKETVRGGMKTSAILLGVFFLLAVAVIVVAGLRVAMGVAEVDIVAPATGVYMSFNMIPVLFKVLVILAVVFFLGTYVLLFLYKKPILREELMKRELPEFSAEDFYQNLEYKLRNIHLTDKVEEVSVFARCSLQEAVSSYKDVVECDMTRLKFLQLQRDTDGYRVKVQVWLRLTECRGKKISDHYERVWLTLFGRPEVIGKSVTTLREYKCPGCGGSLNLLEGGKCSYCGNTFDYGEFGWVIEEYRARRKGFSLYQNIKLGMAAVFAAVFCIQLIFPLGIGRPSIFGIYHSFSAQAAQTEEQYREVVQPGELYEGLTLLSVQDYFISRRHSYRAEAPTAVQEQYRGYLEGLGFSLVGETDNSYTMRRAFEMVETGETEYYSITVSWKGNSLTVDESMGEE